MKDELREAAREAAIKLAWERWEDGWTTQEQYDTVWDAGYEAGKRAERERIIEELDRISDTSDGFDIHSMRIETFIDELRAEPAESGE